MIRYTLLLDLGSTTRGELHRESPRTTYVKNIGRADITADGWCAWGNGNWLRPEQFKTQARALPTRSLTDRVIAEVLARIPVAMARAKQLIEREPVTEAAAEQRESA